MKDKLRTLSVDGYVLQVFECKPHLPGVALVVIRDVIFAREGSVGIEIVPPFGDNNRNVCRIFSRFQLFNQLNSRN